MRIALLASTFHPDHTGTAVYATDLAVYLVERGHDVVVLTSFPHYPSWRKRPADEGILHRVESWCGMRLVRSYVYVPRRATALGRIVYDLTFLASAALSQFGIERPDVVIGFQPPLLLGLVGWILAARSESPLVIHIEDLQLDAALALGMLRRGPAIRLLESVERYIYRKASWIAVLSAGMSTRVIGKGVPPEKVQVVPNWIDLKTIHPGTSRGRFRQRYPELADKRLVGYAGNFGVKQVLHTILDAAAAMAPEFSDIMFLLVGDGADRVRLQALAAEMRLSNVSFLPTQSSEQYAELLDDMDVFVLPQARGAGEVFFPSKFLGILAAGCPIVVSADADTELGRAAQASGGAIVVRAESVPEIVGAVQQLLGSARPDGPGDGTTRFLGQFTREHVLGRYEGQLAQSVDPHRSGRTVAPTGK